MSSAAERSGRLIVDFARESALWEATPTIEGLIGRAARAAVDVAALAHLDDAELSVVLTDDSGIRLLNGTWRAKDKPTNVLSFPAAMPDRIALSPMLGDVVLAFETIDREAVSLGVAFEAHATHLAVHGLLHLFGYDHETDVGAEEMEALETAILASLGIAAPYADQSMLRAAS